MLYGKIDTFPFYYWVSAETKSWYWGICSTSFGKSKEAQWSNKQRASSITDSNIEDSLGDKDGIPHKRIKLITMPTTKEKLK